jgi:hypothetical protein
MPEAIPVKLIGTPAASAINEPFFKNSRRELDIFFPPEPCLKSGLVEMVVQSIASSKNFQQKKQDCEVVAIDLARKKHSCKVLGVDL